jgi:hypothetical protein
VISVTSRVDRQRTAARQARRTPRGHNSATLLIDNPRAAVIKADARDTDDVLNHPRVRRLLDFGRPMGVLIVALLHFIPDDHEAQQLVAALREAMPVGSYMALTHGTTEGISAEARAQVERQYQSATSPFRYRARSEIIPFLKGLTIVEPGIVFSPFRPDSRARGKDRCKPSPDVKRVVSGA